MRAQSDITLLDAARRGSHVARDRLAARYLGTVRAVASRYRDLGLPFDDLVQEGSLGLLEAIELYDADRGIDFEPYARFRVRRSIRNALTDKSRVIRLPKQIVERRRAIDRAESRLAAERGHAPSVAEVAAAIGLPPTAVAETRAAAGPPVSLDQSVLPDGAPLETIVADARARDPEEEAVEHDVVASVDAAVARLPERQREIVSRHFGLGCAPEELADVAHALHLSQQRTRAIERDALYALRDRLDS